MADRKPRVSRSKEERIAELEKKIAAHKANIVACESKIEAIRNPKTRVSQAGAMKSVMDQAKAIGLTPEQIAEKLGITLKTEE